MIEKGVRTDADAVLIDLEDSVTPELKAASRKNVVRAMNDLDWGDKVRAYRVNAITTRYFYRDVIDVLVEAAARVQVIVVPKVSCPEEMAAVDHLLAGMELDLGLTPGSIALEAQIETAEGLVAVERIAQSSNRLARLNFGPGDFAASMQMPMEHIGVWGRWDAEYPGHRFHYAMARVVTAARAAGLDAIDGPVAAFRDREGFRRSCVVARSLGYAGKWCIHPSQISIANEVFSPTPEEMEWAQKVADTYRKSVERGQGAVGDQGTMVDAASIRIAERILEAARVAGTLPAE
jgi:citrate lyase subunit beta/citryl-CoA lyase